MHSHFLLLALDYSNHISDTNNLMVPLLRFWIQEFWALESVKAIFYYKSFDVFGSRIHLNSKIPNHIDKHLKLWSGSCFH